MSVVHKVYRRDNQPFAQIPNDAIRDPRITPNAFRLLAYLMSHRDGYELTYGQIEKQTGLGRYAINGAVHNLTELGWLKTERTKLTNGQYGPKAWYVFDPSTVGNSTVGDSTVEQPTDIKKTNLKEDQDKEVFPQPLVEERFDEFWMLYPRKVEKVEARKVFAKVWKKHGQDVLDGVRRMANDPNLPPKQYVPYPASWLNAGGWTNEPYPERQKSKEELLALEKERIRIRDERDKEKRRLDREREARERAEFVPPEFCDHGRVAVLCPKCKGDTPDEDSQTESE